MKKKNIRLFEYTQDLAIKVAEFAKSVASSVKTIGKVYKMVVSEQGVDRDGEIVLIDWIDLSYYKLSPVVLLDHDYRVEKLVAKTTNIYKEWNKLIAEFEFADTELWRLAQKLYDGWFLKASSIWFIVKERQSDNWFIISKSELLEWSLVVVASNRWALSLDGKEFDLAKSFGLVKDEHDKQEGAVIEGWEMPEWDTPDTPEEEDPEPTNKEIMAEIKEIKILLISIADDKAKNRKDHEVKELMQTANRALDEACRKYKS